MEEKRKYSYGIQNLVYRTKQVAEKSLNHVAKSNLKVNYRLLQNTTSSSRFKEVFF